MPSFSSAEAFHRPASSNTNDIGSRSSRPIRQRISLGFSRSFSSANSLSSISNSTRTTSTKSISTKSLKFKNSSSLWSSVSQVFTRSVGSRLVKAQELSMKISPTLATIEEATSEQSHSPSSPHSHSSSPSARIVLAVDYNSPPSPFHMPRATGVALAPLDLSENSSASTKPNQASDPDETEVNCGPARIAGKYSRQPPSIDYYGPSKSSTVPLRALNPRPRLLAPNPRNSKPKRLLPPRITNSDGSGSNETPLCARSPPTKNKTPDVQKRSNECVINAVHSPQRSSSRASSRLPRPDPLRQKPLPRVPRSARLRVSMKPPSFIPLNALPDSSKPFKRALGAAGSTPLHIGANDQSSRSPATAVKLPSFIPPGTAEVGEEMSIDLPSFTPSRPTALELAYTALEHDLISATTFPTPPPAPSKKEKHTLGLAKAVEKENQLPPANTKRRLEARSSLRRPATSAAKMRTPLVVKERKPGLKAAGKGAGNPSSARPSELSGRSGKTQLRKSGRLSSKVKRESLKEKGSDGKGGGNSSNVTSVATGSKVMRTSIRKIASVGANVDVRSKGTSPTIEGASNLAVLEASARVCPDHGEAPSVIPSETLDLAAVLTNTTPLSYERPPSGIFAHITNLSMRPLLVQAPPKERKSGHHDVSAYRARDRSASQSSSGSSTSSSASAMISPRISVSSGDVFFNKVSAVTLPSATLASSLSSTDTPPALNDTNTASETSKHSTLIPDPVSPISFASYLSDSSSVGSGGTDSDPDTPTTPLSSKLLTPCLDIHSSVETPTALRLHSLRLQCTGRMPTKTLSAAIDWIESENYLGLSPRLPLLMDSRADVRHSVGLEAQAPEKETPAEDTLQRPLATARAPHPANSRQGDANLGRIPVRSNGIGDATGTFPLRSHNATTRTPGATNDTGTSGRAVGLQGRRQLLLTTGFWARGRRTSPGAPGGEAMLRHEYGKPFSTSKGKGGAGAAFSELGYGRLNHVVTNVEQKGVPADGKVGDELVGEADADAEELSVEDRDQNEHEEEKDKAITSQFVQLPQE